MSEGLNRVYLQGNLGQEPTVRYTQSGQAVLNLRMATNERFQRDGEWQERTEWHQVVVFGKRAEGLSKILRKGASLLVEGRLQTRSWETQTGEKRYSTEVVAERVILTGSRPQGQQTEEGVPPPEDDDNV